MGDLPAGVFLTAAVLRALQPPEYEPAHTSMAIVNWTVKHVSRQGAGVLFMLLPGIVALAGCMILFFVWRADQMLRRDAAAAMTALWRHRIAVLMGGAVVAAVGIMALVVGHSIADLPR
jgi:hypothetical protein